MESIVVNNGRNAGGSDVPRRFLMRFFSILLPAQIDLLD